MRIEGLYAICDNSFCPDRPLVSLAEDLLLGGAKILQLRVKGNDDTAIEARREAAQSIMKLKHHFAFDFIINDDPWLTRELGADGVHVGVDDISVDACRRFLGPSKLIGYSSHDHDEAIAAQQAGANYVAFGAIYASPTKGPDHPVQGLRRLKRLSRSLEVPLVAIGGITSANVTDVLGAGASAVAMISALTQASSVVMATQLMREQIEAARRRG